MRIFNASSSSCLTCRNQIYCSTTVVASSECYQWEWCTTNRNNSYRLLEVHNKRHQNLYEVSIKIRTQKIKQCNKTCICLANCNVLNSKILTTFSFKSNAILIEIQRKYLVSFDKWLKFHSHHFKQNLKYWFQHLMRFFCLFLQNIIFPVPELAVIVFFWIGLASLVK